MSSVDVNKALYLLGQRPRRAVGGQLAGAAEPKLGVAWGSFHQGAASSARALLGRRGFRGKFRLPEFFKDCWVESPIPRLAILTAALLHVAFLLAPKPEFAAVAPISLESAEITWSGPIEDLPLIHEPAVKPKPQPEPAKEKPAPEPVAGADAYHPRQTIVTNPIRPNHPRQMLVRPDAPALAPKILPNLPNVVQLAAIAAPARPKIEISAEALRQLHPRERATAATQNTVAPQFTAETTQPAEMSMTIPENAPARPKLQINAGVTPLASRSRAGEEAAPTQVAAPQMAAANAVNAPSTFIALSATPAPPAAVQPPNGNLAARISISPEGKRAGTPPGAASGAGEGEGGSGSAANHGSSVAGISISGGNPRPANTMSGLGGSGGLKLPPDSSLSSRAEARPPADARSARSGPPNFADLPPGARPEQIFASKRVYTLHINMPNLNSATGSWILHFSELDPSDAALRGLSGEVQGPLPLHKVDPRYPPTLIQEHVEGEVVLYAVIRRDGSVDSIQLVRGLDDQLDANSMQALSEWRFRPAMKAGQPIDLEAIVHIPFRAPEER
jgi:TonB family protein